jgi:diamine N-acetyltransferase
MNGVELAPLRPADSDALFEWINDRELVVLNAPFRTVSRAEHDAWFDDIRDRDDVRIFGIRHDDRLVGSCQLHSIHPVHRSAELQIRIGARDAQDRGVGTTAVQLLLRYAFEELWLHRVQLRVFATNARARHVYEGAGFRVEGTQRDAVRLEGAWVDVILMAILAAEFEPSS